MATQTNVQVRGLDEVKKAIAALRFWTQTPVVMILVDQWSQWKLGWLARDDRDFLSTDGRMLPEMIKAAQQGLNAVLKKKDRTADDMLEPWRRAGIAVRDRIAKRLLGGGNDIRAQMRPLAKSTVERKDSSIIGYDTGKLYQDVKSATVVARVPAAQEQTMLRALRETSSNWFEGSVVRPVQQAGRTQQLYAGLREGARSGRTARRAAAATRRTIREIVAREPARPRSLRQIVADSNARRASR